MKILLLDDIDKLGRIGQIKEVARGYANNFLIPKGLAIVATKANKKIVEQQKLEAEKRYHARLKNADNNKAKLETLKLEIEKKAGSSGKLFGAVTSNEIKELIAKEGYDIDKKQIVIEKPIKSIGDYTIYINIYGGIKAALKLTVRQDNAERES